MREGQAIERDAIVQLDKILKAADRNALSADRGARERMIGIQASHCGRIPDDVETECSARDQIAEAGGRHGLWD